MGAPALTKGCDQQAKGGPAGFAQGLFTPGQTKGSQLGQVGKASAVEGEAFPAPDGPVRSEAGPIPGHTYRHASVLVFSQAGQQVGVMVLNTLQWHPMALGQLLSYLAGDIASVVVAGNRPHRAAMAANPLAQGLA
jgi:hypothetical protein